MGCTFHFAIVSVHNRVIKKSTRLNSGAKERKKLISAFQKMDNYFTKTDKMTFFSVFVGFLSLKVMINCMIRLQILP